MQGNDVEIDGDVDADYNLERSPALQHHLNMCHHVSDDFVENYIYSA